MSRILVVDDDPGILESVTILLESEGHAVRVGDDALVLKTLTKDNLPDVLLLDVLLSGADGRELCVQLREQELTKNLPIILFSAHPALQKSRAPQQGPTAFLPKPFDIDELLELISILHPQHHFNR